MPLVHYQVAKPSDSDEVICLLARVFSESEPPAVAMALSFRDFEQFLQFLVPAIIPTGLTVVSRNADTEAVVGVLFTDDFATPPILDLSRISQKFLPILFMLDRLDGQFRKGRTILPREYLHLFMLAVDVRFAGQGIGQGLIKACIDNGVRKGYRTGITEATGKVSQHIFRKNGFADRFRVSYRSFVYENRAVFAAIREHEGAILMDRSLS